MQYICILHTIVIGKRIATAQERIIAVRISESHLEGKKRVFRESINQKREKIAVFQVRSLYIKPNLTKTRERLKVCFGNTEG